MKQKRKKAPKAKKPKAGKSGKFRSFFNEAGEEVTMDDFSESEWSGSDNENDAGEEQALKDMQPLHTPRMLNPGYPDIHRDDQFYHDMDYQGEQDMLFETS